MAGTWSEEERALLQLSEARVNEELSGTSADVVNNDALIQKLHEEGIVKNKKQMLNKLKYMRAKYKVKCYPNQVVWGQR